VEKPAYEAALMGPKLVHFEINLAVYKLIFPAWFRVEVRSSILSPGVINVDPLPWPSGIQHYMACSVRLRLMG
jgi:hypothetical protein